MINLLLWWINHELQLSKKVTDMEKDFASGYLLGEILYKLNQQHNIDDFRASSIADAKIHNFCLLEPTMRVLNIKFDSGVASAIMNQKAGAATNVLYQIKARIAMVSERLKRSQPVSLKSLDRRGIVPLHNMPQKLPKPLYDAENHRLFEHAIRRHVRSVAALRDRQEARDEEKRKQVAYYARLTDEKEQLEVVKAERLHQAYIHSQFIKEALEETDSPAWRLALQKKYEREQRKARFHSQLLEHRRKQQATNASIWLRDMKEEYSFSLRRQVHDDLQEFERKGTTKFNAPGTHIPSRKSVGYGLRSLSASFERSEDAAGGNNARVILPQRNALNRHGGSGNASSDTIRVQKMAREKRREQLDRRRKRFLHECGHQHGQLNGTRLDATLLQVALRQTNSELDAKKQMDNILVYKNIAIENRRLREAQYGVRRDLDHQDAVARDDSIYESFHEQYRDDINIQQVQESDLHIAAQAADHHANQLMAVGVVNEVIDFTILIAGVLEDSMHFRDPSTFLPLTTWSEYKMLFAHGFGPSALSAAYSDEETRLLDRFQLEDYLASFLQFQTTVDTPFQHDVSRTQFNGATTSIDDQFVLGEAVKYVRWISRVIIPEGAEKNEMNTLPPQANVVVSPKQVKQTIGGGRRWLKILFLGPPFSGKNTQAKMLCQRYNLRLLSSLELVEKFLASDHASAVAAEVRRYLQDGTEIPSRLLCALVCDAIAQLGDPNEPAVQSETDPKEPISGWVICDLPSNEETGRYLEEVLTNFVDPELVPSLYDHMSMIAPGCPKPQLPATFLYGKSGLDLVFYLDCAKETVFERCLGFMEDKETHDEYHIIYDPPLPTSTDRHRLQRANHSVHCAELLSLQILAEESAAARVKKWYRRFGTLREIQVCSPVISQTQSRDELHGLVVRDVEELIEGHVQEETRKRIEREEAEQAAMLKEENRTLRVMELEDRIMDAQDEYQARQQALQQGEEQKAKKEEINELKHALEQASKQLEEVQAIAKAWVIEESNAGKGTVVLYSGNFMPPLASVLAETWDATEDEYVRLMKRSFELLRAERGDGVQRATQMVEHFSHFLRRIDSRQTIVNRFQAQFNEVLEEMRFDDSSKIELHARADVLQDELNAVIAAKYAEAEDELNNMTRDGWLEDTCQFIAMVCQMALQAECDRFRVSYQLLIDSFHAASARPMLLNDALEQLRAAKTLTDLPCRVFYDPATSALLSPDDNSQSNTDLAAPAAKVKVTKGKGGKDAAAANANNQELFGNSANSPMSVEELLLSYDDILQRCDALLTIVMSANNVPATSTPTDAAAPTRPLDEDIALSNLIKGIKYEHALMTRRVCHLREIAQDVSDQMRRTIRAVETTLRASLEERRQREEASAAALVQHIRSVIEAEINLPCFINAQPEVLYRFPSTIQLREDTIVRVDSSQRLLPRPPLDPPPVVVPQHPILLNDDQAAALRSVLLDTIGDSEFLPVCLFVEVVTSLTTQANALPSRWQNCDATAISRMGAAFAVLDSPGAVDIDALLAAWVSDEQQFLWLLHEPRLE
ncbi:TPA: hypothetical protein N0F65_011592 [Lagenidium giganteum]|uniref:Calponin-homology (CH) domain-containing protein n=1 Tax=Lagenidium giganteum TaxID=4803 RepID=A0AAV2Z8E7_9STRA|nr:TPA: hypothetical protein N0F65_011592 [Lagenidium giganteum]